MVTTQEPAATTGQGSSAKEGQSVEEIERRLRSEEVTIAQRIESAIQEADRSGGVFTTKVRAGLLDVIAGIKEMYKTVSELGTFTASTRQHE
ncbi:hypothetical protein FOL47_008844 [Perkinsus chesapeaki]|uniref:Uncharacterized protein n=1 Tax=Perkinsus chesapeaki TaxID=330153 RepID=A0A7J6LBH3_PERCH|nr:hypothetical protein FOL47_008844 [Perkinsus chesapeaki]